MHSIGILKGYPVFVMHHMVPVIVSLTLGMQRATVFQIYFTVKENSLETAYTSLKKKKEKKKGHE